MEYFLVLIEMSPMTFLLKTSLGMFLSGRSKDVDRRIHTHMIEWEKVQRQYDARSLSDKLIKGPTMLHRGRDLHESTPLSSVLGTE